MGLKNHSKSSSIPVILCSGEVKLKEDYPIYLAEDFMCISLQGTYTGLSCAQREDVKTNKMRIVKGILCISVFLVQKY